MYLRERDLQKHTRYIMQELVKEVRDVLAEVKYPGTSKSIVALDMVQNIKVEDGNVSFGFPESERPVHWCREQEMRGFAEREAELFGGED